MKEGTIKFIKYVKQSVKVTSMEGITVDGIATDCSGFVVKIALKITENALKLAREVESCSWSIKIDVLFMCSN